MDTSKLTEAEVAAKVLEDHHQERLKEEARFRKRYPLAEHLHRISFHFHYLENHYYEGDPAKLTRHLAGLKEHLALFEEGLT